MKRKLSLLLIVSLFIGMLFPANSFAAVADYVSLGDSNAFGSGLVSEGPPTPPNYFQLFSNYLDAKKGYTAMNISSDGETTASLFNDLTSANLQNAKVITLSIGGNNLLGPVLQAIYGYYSAAPHYVDPSLPGDAKMAALVQHINADPVYWQYVLSQLVVSAKSGGALNKELQKGVQKILADWPLIMKQINSLAPKARVYVLTIYNPLLKDKTLGPIFQTLLLPANSMIRLTPLKYKNVSVVDTSLLFMLNPSALSFNMATYPVTPESIDPHPTKTGHKQIADTMILLDRLKK